MKQMLNKFKIKYEEGSVLWLIVESFKGLIRFFSFFSSIGISVINKMEDEVKNDKEVGDGRNRTGK